MKKEPLKAILNVREASELLGLSARAVGNAAKDGTLPARRVGRRFLFSRDALLRWLDTHPNTHDEHQ